MKKSISGTVVTVMDTPQNKTIVLETAPAVPAAGNKPAAQAKRLQITTNDHTNLDGLERGKPVKLTIEQ